MARSDAPRFRILPLGDQDRRDFASGSPALDRYFHTQVGQDVRRRITACYVAWQGAVIAGFYTISAADIPVAEAPEALTRRLPRYPTLPAARLGRLAVDHRFQGQKLGAALLADAALRAARSEVAVFALIVDAKDAAAEAFYRHHGFTAYPSAPHRLVAGLASLVPPIP